MNNERIFANAKIFKTLNGKDMKVFDYMQNASEEEFIVMLQENFECKMNKEDIQKILNRKIVDIV